MRRILIHIPMIPHGEYDIFSEPDYGALLQVVNGNYHGVCPNLGNRLWFQGLISEISCQENHLEYFSPTMSKDYINSNFDMIIAPMANVFSMAFVSLLESLAERFRGIKIPVYVIACGVQADSYDRLDEICRVLKPSASAFIASVYDTGGEFALRGHFTKDFFERLGFPSAVVTGCPSIYQLGRGLRLPEEKVSVEQFRPVLNGNPSDYSDLLLQYKNAEFFDQSVYYHELWDPSYFAGPLPDKKHLEHLIQVHGFETTSYILANRIKLIPDMNTWREYLIRENFTFSYGSRIHGSIMPILAGVPVVLESRDARTREMAEFFAIPAVAPDTYKKYDSLYDLYQSVSYAAFNAGFAARFDAYEAFLRQYGIVEHINPENRFFRKTDGICCTSANRERRSDLYAVLQQKKPYLKGLDFLINTKRKVLSAFK